MPTMFKMELLSGSGTHSLGVDEKTRTHNKIRNKRGTSTIFYSETNLAAQFVNKFKCHGTVEVDDEENEIGPVTALKGSEKEAETTVVVRKKKADPNEAGKLKQAAKGGTADSDDVEEDEDVESKSEAKKETEVKSKAVKKAGYTAHYDGKEYTLRNKEGKDVGTFKSKGSMLKSLKGGK